MAFDAYDRSLDLLRLLAVLLKKLATRDAELTRQLRRAAQSIALNISEANRRKGGDRPYLFSVALGSAAEVSTCLDVALCFGYLDELEVAPALELLDRVTAMTYRLSR